LPAKSGLKSSIFSSITTKSEALAEFEDERAEMLDQTAFEIALQHFWTEREEVEGVGVFQDLLCKLGLLGRKGTREVGECAALSGK
jgi:hypothetical protein